MLDDLVVVDLTRALAGPHCAMMLADLGARVIKVESPSGDESRGWGPPFVGPEEAPISTYFLSCNRNKESVVADLRTAEGRELLEALVVRADVLLENFRTGVMDRLGFGMDRLRELNPRLVVLSITGFGHDGPEAGRAGYDQIAQGEGGLMSITGHQDGDPLRVGVPIADLLAGMYGAFGIMAALHERERTGLGRVVRTSLLAAVVGVHAHQGTRWTVAHEVPVARGNHHAAIAPYGTYQTRSGPIQIACGTDAQWGALSSMVELDKPEWNHNAARVADWDALTAALEAQLRTKDAEEWLVLLREAGIPAGQVRTIDQVYAWEQTLSQGLLVEAAHPILGDIALPGPPLRFDGGPSSGARTRHDPPPALGAHTESVKAWLGLGRATSETAKGSPS